ncbi:polysaccharide deacetylase family protein [Fredinandcohnia sp. 179-A 10B2 NHS]|uniref:polysaccharide deacetylase family protein n=1 Tax=Fredinandcohnia sp. 179-A 10B2 NHS TaxID=3235176 RepID=UPI0039A3E31A
MKKNGVRSKELASEFTPYLNKPGIVFSFDDSFRVQDWYKYGRELFGFYDVKVTFNVNAFHHYEGKRELSQSEIDLLIDLQSYGHEIAHHGYNHRNAVDYVNQLGVKKWIQDEIIALFDWLNKQAHSVTGEKFKKPVTFAFPYFRYNDSILEEIVPTYFRIARGHLRGNYLSQNNLTGFAPSICIDSHYLINKKNIKKVINFVKKSGSNLILTCHSLLPEDVGWERFGWEMEKHEQRWRTSPEIIEFIINEAKKVDLEFYTTAELSGVANFIDRNFEKYIRDLFSIEPDQCIFISDLISIKELDLSNKNITNLDGIQYFLGLEKLDISNNNITDLRLLGKLPNLNLLSMNNNLSRKL